MINVVAEYAKGRRNFSGADLTGADLSSADLSRASLSRAKLPGADLTGADLSSADLSRADLSRASLPGANLSWTNLSWANLSWADLSWVNLSWANLSGANLSRANILGADLSGANLSGANLSGANLAGADLSNARLPHFQICPERGSFLAYKKLQGNALALVRIPRDAARTSSLVGRKCRAERVLVIAVKGSDGKPLASGVGILDQTEYAVGSVVAADSWDPDPRVECTHGIHFFVTRREAEEYHG